jgi:hypothetical protein
MTLGVPTMDAARPAYWMTDGEGDETTILYEAKKTGFRLIAWEADCPVRMRLNRWDGADVSDEYALGTAREASFIYPMRKGDYFFDAVADCAWEVSVRSL